MIAHFKSIDKEGNVTEFDSICEYKNNTYSFKDLATENTMIYITIDASTVTIKRLGNTNMEIFLANGIKTSGYYKNNLGLEFNFYTLTTDLSINSCSLYASYSLFMENDKINEHKMWILFD